MEFYQLFTSKTKPSWEESFGRGVGFTLLKNPFVNDMSLDWPLSLEPLLILLICSWNLFDSSNSLTSVGPTTNHEEQMPVLLLFWPLLSMNRIPLTSGCYKCDRLKLWYLKFVSRTVGQIDASCVEQVDSPQLFVFAQLFGWFAFHRFWAMRKNEGSRQPCQWREGTVLPLDIWIEFNTTNSEWGLESTFLFYLCYVLFMAS